jgi:hypothetical protein
MQVNKNYRLSHDAVIVANDRRSSVKHYVQHKENFAVQWLAQASNLHRGKGHIKCRQAAMHGHHWTIHKQAELFYLSPHGHLIFILSIYPPNTKQHGVESMESCDIKVDMAMTTFL